jgi:hypothetical protein
MVRISLMYPNQDGAKHLSPFGLVKTGVDKG